MSIFKAFKHIKIWPHWFMFQKMTPPDLCSKKIWPAYFFIEKIPTLIQAPRHVNCDHTLGCFGLIMIYENYMKMGRGFYIDFRGRKKMHWLMGDQFFFHRRNPTICMPWRIKLVLWMNSTAPKIGQSTIRQDRTKTMSCDVKKGLVRINAKKSKSNEKWRKMTKKWLNSENGD